MIFFIPTCIVSIIINWKNKNIQKETAIIISLFGIIGAFIGAYIGTKIDVILLKKMFGLFLIFIGIFEIYKFIKNLKNEYKKQKR